MFRRSAPGTASSNGVGGEFAQLSGNTRSSWCKRPKKSCSGKRKSGQTLAEVQRTGCLGAGNQERLRDTIETARADAGTHARRLATLEQQATDHGSAVGKCPHLPPPLAKQGRNKSKS